MRPNALVVCVIISYLIVANLAFHDRIHRKHHHGAALRDRALANQGHSHYHNGKTGKSNAAELKSEIQELAAMVDQLNELHQELEAIEGVKNARDVRYSDNWYSDGYDYEADDEMSGLRLGEELPIEKGGSLPFDSMARIMGFGSSLFYSGPGSADRTKWVEDCLAAQAEKTKTQFRKDWTKTQKADSIREVKEIGNGCPALKGEWVKKPVDVESDIGRRQAWAVKCYTDLNPVSYAVRRYYREHEAITTCDAEVAGDIKNFLQKLYSATHLPSMWEKLRGLYDEQQADTERLSEQKKKNFLVLYTGLAVLKGMKEGDAVSDEGDTYWGPVSTSLSLKVAQKFGKGGAVFQIDIPIGLMGKVDAEKIAQRQKIAPKFGALDVTWIGTFCEGEILVWDLPVAWMSVHKSSV